MSEQSETPNDVPITKVRSGLMVQLSGGYRPEPTRIEEDKHDD